MAVLIGLAVASFAAAGLAIFGFRYRGLRARCAGLSAFGLGLAVVVAFVLIHATVGPEHPVAGIAFVVSHVAMCMVELLLLGAVLSLRDPPSAAYRRAEVTVGLVLAGVAVVVYGGAAWSSPWEQDQVSRHVFFAIPLLSLVATVARFGLGREGLVGGGVFLALVVSGVAYLFLKPYEPGRAVVRAIAEGLTLAGSLGIPVFFFVAASHAELARTPWPGGSLGMNRARMHSAGLLILGLAGCGYVYSSITAAGWLASSNWRALRVLLSAAAYSACLAGVFGLTTGRHFWNTDRR